MTQYNHLPKRCFWGKKIKIKILLRVYRQARLYNLIIEGKTKFNQQKNKHIVVFP